MPLQNVVAVSQIEFASLACKMGRREVEEDKFWAFAMEAMVLVSCH